ncbi:superoxide reductase [Clostridia bacterium]|nr:superoxide reductase [Clostridia bacterium]
MTMIESAKFYTCTVCGKIVGMIHDPGVPTICCGQPMQELIANTTDAAQEKHVPVVARDGDTITVKVGAVSHPMLPEHYIQWIYVRTENGGQRHAFAPGDSPDAKFYVGYDKPVEVYEFCNLHGLWKTVL